MLAKALQINSRLRCIYWDRNNTSPQGFATIAAALEKYVQASFSLPIPPHLIIIFVIRRFSRLCCVRRTPFCGPPFYSVVDIPSLALLKGDVPSTSNLTCIHTIGVVLSRFLCLPAALVLSAARSILITFLSSWPSCHVVDFCLDSYIVVIVVVVVFVTLDFYLMMKYNTIAWTIFLAGQSLGFYFCFSDVVFSLQELHDVEDADACE